MVRPAPQRQQLQQALEGLLEQTVDELLPSERALARRFGGCRSTLRLALEDLAAEGLIEHVPGKGWRHCRQQRLLWIDHRPRIHRDILAGIRSTLPASWRLESVTQQRPIAGWSSPPWNHIDPHRHRAVLLFNEGGVPEFIAEALASAGTILCCLGCGQHQPYDTVCADYAQMSRLLVEEAMRVGHRRIAFVGTHSTHKHLAAFMARVHGYRTAMTNHGLDPDVVMLGQRMERLQDQLAAWLREREREGRRPTCCYCSGTGYVPGLLQVLAKLGLRVPEDMSIAGYGHSSEAMTAYRVGYSHYTQLVEPWFALGQAAGLRCRARLESPHPTPPALTLVPSCIELGDSLQPPKE